MFRKPVMAPVRTQSRPLSALAAVLLTALAAPVIAAERAVLLVDADSGSVLEAENALKPSFPASLTKLMTLYVAFDALHAGRIARDAALPVSKAAAAAPPVRLGLKAGDTITLDDAISALIVTSGNDVAAVIAEAIGGSEEAFVELMNARARDLGLAGTRFRNASGLPDPAQITTARDMAELARALRRTFPDDYARFAADSFSFRGRRITSHNNFLRGYPGARGLKTGFTCKAGFNLVAAAERDGRHLLGVVLGAATAAARDARMVRMMNAGFRDSADLGFNLDRFPQPDHHGAAETVNGRFLATECINPQPGSRYFAVRGWTILLGGVDRSRAEALARARGFLREHKSLLGGGQPMLVPRWARDVIYQIGITGLTRENATNTCLGIRNDRTYCVVRTPEAAEYAMQQALRIMDAVAE